MPNFPKFRLYAGKGLSRYKCTTDLSEARTTHSTFCCRVLKCQIQGVLKCTGNFLNSKTSKCWHLLKLLLQEINVWRGEFCFTVLLYFTSKHHRQMAIFCLKLLQLERSNYHIKMYYSPFIFYTLLCLIVETQKNYLNL